MTKGIAVMKNTTRKIWAIIILVLIVFGGVVFFKGIGSVKPLKDKMKYGLDINGGVYVLLEAKSDKKGQDQTKLMEQTKSVLENRVNAMGISEATVSIEGKNRIRVEMPGVEDADSAIKQIGRTAQLKFLLADGTFVMNGNEVKDAGFAQDTDHGQYKITMDFTNKGSDDFAAATEKAASGQITPTMTDESGRTVDPTAVVIMLDDKVVSAPTVNQKIVSRSCEIFRPGGFTKEEASQTSALIRGGALPASLTEVNSSVETATIGENALKTSVKAGFLGLLLVFLVMILVYRLLGVIASIALTLYVEVVLWIMAGLGAVLTLPGIAGIILSIGMAVDSNVIIFTRIREEIEKGKSERVAIDMGFKSALPTVIDSQTTTLIAAFVLYLIGTTAVKGFALTLMIGTVCSIFTAVFITQIFVQLLGNSRFCKPSIFGIGKDGQARFKWKKQFRFIKNRKAFYAISAVIIIIGMCFAAVKGFNYGIDFTGGTTIQLDMHEKVKIDDVKKTIKDYDLKPTIVYAGKNNDQIVIRTIKALRAADRDKVVATLGHKYGITDKDVLASEQFGPTVGKELRHNAVKSILIAGFFMLLYIIFRFKTWKYGVAAVSGLLHDILITLSLYAIFGFTINNPFIAGILTVVGYSINDTIVVFDRIRENHKFYKRKELEQLVDSSINQTLSRSIITSLTTLIVMVPLFFVVSSNLREFLIPLIIGVTAGTYSSIFLCSPLYYEFTRKESVSKYTENKNKQDKQRAKKNKAAEGIVK